MTIRPGHPDGRQDVRCVRAGRPPNPRRKASGRRPRTGVRGRRTSVRMERWTRIPPSPPACSPSCATWRPTTTASGSRPTRLATRPTSRSRRSPSWRTSPTASRRAAPPSSPTRGPPAARCSASTATPASPRTRRRTRRTSACASATRRPRRARARLLPAPRAGQRVRRRRLLPSGPGAAARHPRPHAHKPEAWTPRSATRVRGALPARRGSALKRAPAGSPADHPLIEDLKRKDVAGFAQLTEADALAPGFLDVFDELCRTAAPLVRFLCDAAGVPYEV